jgi:hypothetical protein
MLNVIMLSSNILSVIALHKVVLARITNALAYFGRNISRLSCIGYYDNWWIVNLP